MSSMIENFAEWLRRQGHMVLRTPGSYWVNSGPRVYQAFPYHWLIHPPEEEITGLLREQRAIAVRYSMPLEAESGSLSYHVIYRDETYGYECLSKKARHDVEKGLSLSRIERIPFQRLASEGWELRRDTLIRQGRLQAGDESEWTKLCLSAAGLDGFEAWGAIVGGTLAAALLAFQGDGHFSILYQQSLTKYLQLAVNNALTYAVTLEVVQRAEPQKIFYGLHSLDAPPSVDNFKFRMAYKAEPVRQKVDFHPQLKLFVSPASHALLRGARKMLPASPALAKAEGMFRFYLQGNLPISKQIPPGPLNDLTKTAFGRPLCESPSSPL